jgi:indole-3-glycerol phosphate synthase
LDRIIATKRQELAERSQSAPLVELRRRAANADLPRDFYGALAHATRSEVHLIAEIKKKSPSAGLIRRDFDPAAIARIYEAAGSSAISVLTDQTYFDGRLEYIAQVKQACSLPVLRKDFTIDAYQLYEARAHGADAVLLITEVLGADRVAELADLANELQMTALIEVHRSDLLADLAAKVDFSPGKRRLLGINNRDLTAQHTDLSVTERLAEALTIDPLLVSESGINTRCDVLRAARAGAVAILVGEAILRSPDMSAKIEELLGELDGPQA